MSTLLIINVAVQSGVFDTVLLLRFTQALNTPITIIIIAFGTGSSHDRIELN